MPGRLIEYIVNFPRVVGGIDEESTRRAVELYRHIVKREITPADVLTAEVAKAVENAYRDVNIAFANEVALICGSLGVNVYQVRELINARPDRDMHLPGAGVGGHCLPKDTWLLHYGARTYGNPNVSTELVSLARRINDAMPLHTAQLVEEALEEKGATLDGARVAVMGYAYLENSDDTRNTPALPLVRALEAKGASVVVHDPFVRQVDDGVNLTHDLEQALRRADCAVIVTRHQEYYDLDPARAKVLMRTPVLVDGRNVFASGDWRQAGFVYRGVGK
jgi:UDP-N-acetyl-D-mannosaminuronic acid dehydrogenase